VARGDSSAWTEAFERYRLAVAEARFTAADVAYIRRNYFTLIELSVGRAESVADVEALVADGHLPRPSYVLADGTAMFPGDTCASSTTPAARPLVCRQLADAQLSLVRGAGHLLPLKSWRVILDAALTPYGRRS
jgi:hypothetical protein